MKNAHIFYSGLLVALMNVIMISGCSDSSTDRATEEPKVNYPGFIADVSGAVNSKVSGDGIVTYLPPKERDNITGNRPGYYLLANNLLANPPDELEPIITFRIPHGAQPGNYLLTTPDPLKIGEDFDAQVEMVKEGELVSYQSNTEGTITLDNFSLDHNQGETHTTNTVKGTFQFITENNEGEQVSVNGTFDFSPAMPNPENTFHEFSKT